MRSKSVVPVLAAALVAALTLVPSARAQAQAPERAWRLSFGGAVYEVDRLVGTPFVPSASISRILGRHGFVGLEVNGIFNKGFYSATALTGDLDLGVRFPMDRAEVTLSAGPSGIAGGDSDGTPYLGGGVHGAVGATAWITGAVGLQARARVRRWWGVGDDVLLGLSAGVVIRL